MAGVLQVEETSGAPVHAASKAVSRVAIAGLGAIGTSVAKAIDAGIEGVVLSAVSAQSIDKHRDWLSQLKSAPAILPIEQLADVADIIIECAPSRLVRSIVAPAVSRGKTAIVLSAGALLDTGALIGLDAVTAAAVGTIHSARMVSRKPPRGFAGAPHVVDNNIDLEAITAPRKIFEGNARAAAKGFPANINVSVALSLAGIGPDLTTVEIWADPTVTRNVHRIEVDSDSARFSMTIENIPSENPKTGRITALSVIAYLRKLHAPLRVGT